MGITKDRAKKKPMRKRATKVSRTTARGQYVKLFDAKKFQGIIPAFAEITLEEMRSWRDDR